MILIVSQDDIKVPICTKGIQSIEDYISYYKFISNQLIQSQNHLESRIYNKSSNRLLKAIEKYF